MVPKYKHLLGKRWKHGEQDCFTACRDFYRDNGIVDMPNYARPDRWWERNLNLYMEHFHTEGFRVIDVHPRYWQVGDGFLMAIGHSQPTHAGVYVGDGKIFHHFIGRRSNVELYSSEWRVPTVAVVRHLSMMDYKPPQSVYDLMQDPRIQQRIRDNGSAA